jgi:LmbE family N-acetylglucosaminyl deacetylase
MNRIVLIIAAHADDEVLGCGGTIARHTAEGDTVHVVFMADGVGSRDQIEATALTKRNEARDAALRILGVSHWYALDFPDNRLDSTPLLDVVKALEPIIQHVAPEIIYTHHYGDLNVDHRITHQAVMTACRPQPGSTVREILTFEIMSSTEWASPGLAPFIPNTYIDISNFLHTKIQALTAYELEMRPAPHSRSIAHLEILAQHHGYCVGVKAAEAFMVMRSLR